MREPGNWIQYDFDNFTYSWNILPTHANQEHECDEGKYENERNDIIIFLWESPGDI